MVEHVIRTYQLRSRRQRLFDAGLIPLSQMARLLGVSTGTVKIWYHWRVEHAHWLRSRRDLERQAKVPYRGIDKADYRKW
jgi:hypothetical protein